MNSRRIIVSGFCALFMLMITVPLVFTNLKPGVISQSENRILAPMPSLYGKDGTINRQFPADFEEWINDNIGFRSQMVIANARIQYHIFNLLSNNSDRILGPDGEINFAPDYIIKDYQHLNLKSEEVMGRIADSYQVVNDYLEEQGIQFYYMQCWDKHSIYPEYFPTSVIQYGSKSKTDMVIERLQSETTVDVISPKEELLAAKETQQPYSRYGDATHWSQRGAYIGYLKMMEEINRRNEGRFRILMEPDYDIEIVDMGSTLFGGIHKVDMLEQFTVRNPQARETNEKLSLFADDKRHRFYTNDSADNDIRLLIIGDSYLASFLLDDLAESFHETVLIWGDYLNSFTEIVDAYQPDIVLMEDAERVDRFEGMIGVADQIYRDGNDQQ